MWNLLLLLHTVIPHQLMKVFPWLASWYRQRETDNTISYLLSILSHSISKAAATANHSHTNKPGKTKVMIVFLYTSNCK